MSLAILFHFLCVQHVSDINISIISGLRLCCWITTSVVLFSVRCVLDLWCGWFWVVFVLQAEAVLQPATKPLQGPQIFSNTAMRTSDLQRHRYRNLKSSATPLWEPQIFRDPVIGTPNLQQHHQNLKSSTKPLQGPQISSNTAMRTSNLQQYSYEKLKSRITSASSQIT